MSASHNIDVGCPTSRRFEIGRDLEDKLPGTSSSIGQNGNPPQLFPQFSRHRSGQVAEEHEQQQQQQQEKIKRKRLGDQPGKSTSMSDGSSSNSGGTGSSKISRNDGGGDSDGDGNVDGNVDGDDNDPYQEDDFVFDATDLPNDTLATILSLQREFYNSSNSARTRGKKAADGGALAGRGREKTGIVLQHQIYTVLENRTAVDLELVSMRKDNVLRTFRLGTGREDWGFMSTEHYLRVISNMLGKPCIREQDPKALAGVRSGGQGQNTISGSGKSASRSQMDSADTSTNSSSAQRPSSLARDVLEQLVLSNTMAYVSRNQVVKTMADVLRIRRDGAGSEGKGAAGERKSSRAEGNIVADESRSRGLGHIKGKRVEEVRIGEGGDEDDLRSLRRREKNMLSVTRELIRAGFLLPRRDVGREEAYWFSMPQLGKAITAISRGRKDVMGALKRTRYKEMRRAALEAKNPTKTTGLPVSFHIRDLLGLGMIQQLDTPSGAFLRLASDA